MKNDKTASSETIAATGFQAVKNNTNSHHNPILVWLYALPILDLAVLSMIRVQPCEAHEYRAPICQ